MKRAFEGGGVPILHIYLKNSLHVYLDNKIVLF